MPHVKKLVLSEYCTVDSITDTPLFRKYMTLNRFRQLLRFLHFADNNEPNYEDRLGKLEMRSLKLWQSFMNITTQVKSW